MLEGYVANLKCCNSLKDSSYILPDKANPIVPANAIIKAFIVCCANYIFCC